MTFGEGQVRRDGVLVRKFGGPVRYTAIGEGTVDITGVFQNPTRQTQAGNRPVNARFPLLLVLRSEVPNLRKGDLFEIDSIDYRCKEPGPDEGEVISAKLEELR